jgi:hypothetical protein
MDNHSGAAAVRAAVERIQAERKDWQDVGLMAIEHLESGACGVVLVPSDAPEPNWSQQLLPSIGLWEKCEDVTLVTWLQRWYADLSSRPDERWTEWTNLLRRHCPATLVASLPSASRQLAVGHGFGVHALPPAAGNDLLGRLVAWALPWQELTMPRRDGGEGRKRTRACASWVSQPGLVRSWTRDASMGAAGLTRLERLRSGGLHQWGILAAWPSAIDVLVGFLLAQADAMEACTDDPVAAPKPVRRQPKWRPLSKDRRHVVLVAVSEVMKQGSVDAVRPGKDRQEAAYRWAQSNRNQPVHDALARIRADWLPSWFLDCLRAEEGTSLTAGSLLGQVKDLTAFQRSVRGGMKEEQRRQPA